MPSTIQTQAFFAAILALGVSGRSWAQESDASENPAQTSEKSAPASTEKPSASHKDDDTIDYEKFVKGLKKAEGPMALYQKGKNIYLELPEAQLGKIFLIQAAFESGLDSMFRNAHRGASCGCVPVCEKRRLGLAGAAQHLQSLVK